MVVDWIVAIATAAGTVVAMAGVAVAILTPLIQRLRASDNLRISYIEGRVEQLSIDLQKKQDKSEHNRDIDQIRADFAGRLDRLEEKIDKLYELIHTKL